MGTKQICKLSNLNGVIIQIQTLLLLMINEANHNFLLLNSQVDFEVLKSHLPTELTNEELSYCKTVRH